MNNSSTQRPVQHERRGHAPVSSDLAQPVVFLRAHRPDNFQVIVGALRPKLAEPPVARLAHFRLAAQIVEMENQLSIGIAVGFLAMEIPPWDFGSFEI